MIICKDCGKEFNHKKINYKSHKRFCPDCVILHKFKCLEYYKKNQQIKVNGKTYGEKDSILAWDGVDYGTNGM